MTFSPWRRMMLIGELVAAKGVSSGTKTAVSDSVGLRTASAEHEPKLLRDGLDSVSVLREGSLFATPTITGLKLLSSWPTGGSIAVTRVAPSASRSVRKIGMDRYKSPVK